MSCSDNLVTKEYLDQQLANQRQALIETEIPQVTKAFVEKTETDFSGLLNGLRVLVQAMVDGIGAGLAALGYYVGELAEQLNGAVKRLDDQVEAVANLDIRLFAIEQFQNLQNLSINSLEYSLAQANSDIANLNSALAQANADIAALKRRDSELINLVNDLGLKLNQIIEESVRRDLDLQRLIEQERSRIEQIKRELAEINIEQINQNDRLRFIDESFIELDQILRILIQEYGQAFAGFAVGIARLTEDLYNLDQKVNNLPQLQPTPTPTVLPPSLRSYPVGSGTAIEITTEGGTDRAIIPFPQPEPLPDLTPSIDLIRVGNNLTINVGIAGKTATDTESLPQPLIEETNVFTRFVRENVDLSQLEEQARQIQAQQTLMSAAIMTVIANNSALLTQTAPDALRQAAAAGSCESLNGGCGQNFRNQIQQDGLQNLGAANIAGTGGVLAQVAAVQSRLDTLFNRLGVDRMMHALNIALGVHNAVAVSRAVGQTAGYVVDATAQAAGFQWQDTEGNPITFSQAIGSTATGFITNAVGADLANNTVSDFNKLLRVYQTGQNVAWGVRGIIDPIRNATDIITENTGKIGNALRKSGSVLENSYTIMPEQATLQSATQKKLETYTASVQNIGEGLELFGELSENVIEIQENKAQLQESNQAFQTEINTLGEEAEGVRTTEKTGSQSPSISLSDLIPQPIQEP